MKMIHNTSSDTVETLFDTLITIIDFAANSNDAESDALTLLTLQALNDIEVNETVKYADTTYTRVS
jgi:hypothetical protein